MAILTIGVPLSRQEWCQALRAHLREHVGKAAELVVLHDSAEALGADVDAVVIDDTADFLSSAQVVELRERPTRVVGFFHPASRMGRGRQWLVDLGLGETDLFPVETSPAVLVDALSTLNGTGRRRRVNGSALAAVDQRSRRGLSADDARRGTVVALGGGPGAPGRTDMGVGFSRVLSTRGRVVLVDLDEHNPSVAVRLGFQVSPNVLDAVAAFRAGKDVGSCVARRAGFAVGEVGFDVVCGLADPGDWGQLGGVDALLGALAQQWDWVVVDTGPSCTAEDSARDGLRNPTTRAALGAADVVVGVCRASPPGVVRFLDWAGSALGVMDDAATFGVVLNNAPSEQFQRGQLRSEVLTHLPDGAVSHVDFVARDPRVDAAVWDARPHALAGVDRVVDRFAPNASASAARSRMRRVLAGFGG